MKLKEIVEICYGKNQKQVEVEKSDIPILGTGGIIGYSSKPLYDKESVLIGRKGTIGMPFYVNKPFWTIDTLFYTKINTNIVIPKFLYYLLCTIGLSRYSEGAAIPSLTTKTLYEIDLKVPNKDIQQHIVNTIGSIDDLIESNAKFINKFQQFLSQIYKIYCLDINDEVELNSLIVRTGKILKNKEWFGSNVLDLSTMPNNNIFINDFSCGENFTTNIKTLNNLDLVYGSIRPYFKKAGFALDVDYIAGSVYSFKPLDKKNYLWVLACICSDEFHLFTSSNSQGTKMPIINWDTFSSFKIRYDSEIIYEFNEQIQPLFDLCVTKAREIRRLKDIKEKLLSKYF